MGRPKGRKNLNTLRKEILATKQNTPSLDGLNYEAVLAIHTQVMNGKLFDPGPVTTGFVTTKAPEVEVEEFTPTPTPDQRVSPENGRVIFDKTHQLLREFADNANTTIPGPINDFLLKLYWEPTVEAAQKLANKAIFRMQDYLAERQRDEVHARELSVDGDVRTLNRV